MYNGMIGENIFHPDYLHYQSYYFPDSVCIFFFFFFYEWEQRTGTMCPFSSLHPLRKGKQR